MKSVRDRVKYFGAHEIFMMCGKDFTVVYTQLTLKFNTRSLASQYTHTHTHSLTVHRSLKSGLLLLCAPSRCNTQPNEYIFVKRRENDWRIQRTPFASVVGVCVCVLLTMMMMMMRMGMNDNRIILFSLAPKIDHFSNVVSHTRARAVTNTHIFIHSLTTFIFFVILSARAFSNANFRVSHFSSPQNIEIHRKRYFRTTKTVQTSEFLSLKELKKIFSHNLSNCCWLLNPNYRLMCVRMMIFHLSSSCESRGRPRAFTLSRIRWIHKNEFMAIFTPL